MEEDLAIINSNTRNEKIKNFFLNNRKKFFVSLLILLVLIVSFYIFQIYKDKNRIQISDKYNSAVIDFNNVDKQRSIASMKQIIKNKDSTYSPLALYFLLDNELISNNDEINENLKNQHILVFLHFSFLSMVNKFQFHFQYYKYSYNFYFP